MPTRAKAQAAVIAGAVRVDGARATKPATTVTDDAHIEVDQPPKYVSRGGDKLEGALIDTGLEVTGADALDLGASTGGFTDCLLKHGADRVIAVDVGYGQLAWPLRNDPRVTVMEETNARYLKPEQVPYQPDLVTADLSFISLALLFPVIRGLGPTRIVCLVKPQFEAGAKNLRKGVVRDPKIHLDVLRKIWEQAHFEGLEGLFLTHSPLKGPAGNVEFLAGFRLLPDNLKLKPYDPSVWEQRLVEAVDLAQREL